MDESSILNSIKKLIGIAKDDNNFDTDIIIHINSVFMTLNQLGVGPPTGFKIEDETSDWTDFIEDTTRIEAIKTYMYLKVKLVFDPPINSSVIKSYEQTINELEWRINTEAEIMLKEEENQNDSAR